MVQALSGRAGDGVGSVPEVSRPGLFFIGLRHVPHGYLDPPGSIVETQDSSLPAVAPRTSTRPPLASIDRPANPVPARPATEPGRPRPFEAGVAVEGAVAAIPDTRGVRLRSTDWRLPATSPGRSVGRVRRVSAATFPGLRDSSGSSFSRS